MIEREIIGKRMREILIQDYIRTNLASKHYGKIEVTKTPLGEKIIVHTTRPGFVVGRAGENISRLTRDLKSQFSMENPQIEVSEIEDPFLNPQSIAERIVGSFERFGPKRFKSIGYRSLQDIMNAGAVGAEIVISGRGVPSSRSKTWRFSAGHLKKSGDIAENHLLKNISVVHLKSGAIGIKVSILTPDTKLPDDIKFKGEDEEVEVTDMEEKSEEKSEQKLEEPKVKKKSKKKVTDKKTKEVKENGKEKGTPTTKQRKPRKKVEGSEKTTNAD